MKALVASVVIALLLVQVLATVAQPQSGEKTGTRNLLSLLKNGIKRLRKIASRINDTKLVSELLDYADRIKALVDKAENC